MPACAVPAAAARWYPCIGGSPPCWMVSKTWPWFPSLCRHANAFVTNLNNALATCPELYGRSLYTLNTQVTPAGFRGKADWARGGGPFAAERAAP